MQRLSAAVSITTVLAGSVVLVTGPQAMAATWKPTWTTASPKGGTVHVDLGSVSVPVSVHLWLHNKDPRVKTIKATASGPGGWRTTVTLKLGKGWTTQRGTWSGHVPLPAKAPAGTWHVGFTATSTKNQTATHANAASFKIAKTAYPAISVTPGTFNLAGKDATVTVQTFWAKHVDGAHATLTDPSGKTFDGGDLKVARGTADYGLWRTARVLSRYSVPGRWKVTTRFYIAGTGHTGPASTFLVRKAPDLQISASAKQVKQAAPFTVRGRLGAKHSNAVWAPLIGRRVELWVKPRITGVGWERWAVLKSDSTGRFHYVARPAASGSYQFRYAGDGGLFLAVTSPSIWVSVVGH